MTHEDNRRILTSIPYLNGEIKIIVAKQDCELGNHYHKIKTERFTLIEGESILFVGRNEITMDKGKEYVVKPNQMHQFKIKEDSILFCICSHPYNKNDDYK